MKRWFLCTIGLTLLSACNPNPINPLKPNWPSNVSTSVPTPAPSPTIATEQQLLRSCKNQVVAEFPDVKFRDVSVSMAPADQQGNKIVRWQLNTGAAGYCRMNATGGLVGFVSETSGDQVRPIQPSDPGQITSQQLNVCSNEVARELRTVPIADIYVYPASLDNAGTALINWETRGGSFGYCRVTRQGQLAKFVVHNLEATNPPTIPPIDPPRPTDEPRPDRRPLVCSGKIGSEWWFNAFYGENGFGKVDLDNFKTKMRQTVYLRYDGVESGQAIFRGQVPGQPNLVVKLSHPAGRLLSPGDTVQAAYGQEEGSGTCQDRQR